MQGRKGVYEKRECVSKCLYGRTERRRLRKGVWKKIFSFAQHTALNSAAPKAKNKKNTSMVFAQNYKNKGTYQSIKLDVFLL